MIRNLKALGLVVVAALAMSAMVASAAQAEAITTQKLTAQDGTYPEAFHGENPIAKETFITEAGAVECDSTFSGSLSEASTTVSVKASYTNCRAFGGLFAATVNMTGCEYKFHLTTKLSAHKYQAHADLTCTPTTDHVDIVAGPCEIHIDEQLNMTTVDIEVMTGAKNDITVDPNVEGINYTVVKDGFGCPFSGTGAKTGAKYIAHEPVTVTSAGGIHIG